MAKKGTLIKMCAEETDLNCINQLEVPPQGDCVLGEIKRKNGYKLGMMGNLHTTSVMLLGSYNDAFDASRNAIDAAARGGGFILSTGDRCGRDTPDRNIQAMIDAVRLSGQY